MKLISTKLCQVSWGGGGYWILQKIYFLIYSIKIDNYRRGTSKRVMKWIKGTLNIKSNQYAHGRKYTNDAKKIQVYISWLKCIRNCYTLCFTNDYYKYTYTLISRYSRSISVKLLYLKNLFKRKTRFCTLPVYNVFIDKPRRIN